jgi:hypothetical protein
MERHGDPKHQMRERSVIPVETSRECLHWEGGGREEERFHVVKLAFNIVRRKTLPRLKNPATVEKPCHAATV